MFKPLAVAALAALAVQPVLASDETPAAGAAAETRDCIDLSRVAGRNADGPQSIRFELIGGEVWRNELPGRCPGLGDQARGFGALAFEVQGNRLCRNDRVRVVDSSAGVGRGFRMAIPCPLGNFRLVQERREARN